ncbi:related to aminotriazole resistance protein [Cephalotrichum gorgonifer]|uniref:Related to aminotriazole resistance protein n=1 Tax=Cephalotrichum gorgonifer TaxID=2041049 RepID=A0AAE8SWX9_9PEZI|nr:related to aminotriazole resistance protein [Cephalotrichum gorgonifer]
MSPDPEKPEAVREQPAQHRPESDPEKSPAEPHIRASDDDDVRDEEYSFDNPPPLPFSKARCIAIVATTTGASFMNTFSVQATVIILPGIARDLEIPSSRLQWVVSAYALAFGCFLLLWGRIADVFGKRFIFAAGTAWVAAVSAANPFLKNEIAFDLFRGLHGLGSAANVPTAIGILGTTFPPGKAKNYAFSTYAAGAPLGSIFGNLLAGFIAEYASWKWVFAIMAIVSAIIAAASLFVIPPPPPKLRPADDEGDSASPSPSLASVDWVGGALVTAGLLALMFALTEGNVVGWSTPWIPALIVVSLLVIGLFAAWQWYLENKTSRAPLVRLSVFRNGKFSAALVIMGLFFSSFNNLFIYATYFFQNYQGLSVLQTTLRFIPTGVVGIIVAAIAAQLLSRVPTYYLLLFGCASVSVACLLFAVPIPPHTTYFAYGLPALCLAVMGADTTWPALTLYVSSCLSDEDQALGGALSNAVGQVGRAVGLALSTVAQTSVMARERGVSVQDAGEMVEWEDATLRGIRAANWTTFALGCCAFLVVAVMFRGSGVVGRIGTSPGSGGPRGARGRP